MPHLDAEKIAAGFASRLSEERANSRLTQRELAEKLGISRNSVTLYESARQLPGAEVLMGLNELGMDVFYLLTGHRKKNPPIDIDALEICIDEVIRQSAEASEPLTKRDVLARASAMYKSRPLRSIAAPKSFLEIFSTGKRTKSTS